MSRRRKVKVEDFVYKDLAGRVWRLRKEGDSWKKYAWSHSNAWSGISATFTEIDAQNEFYQALDAEDSEEYKGEMKFD